MDYISILQQFKKDNVKAGETMPFSLLPFLFLELEKNGFTQENLNTDFYKTVVSIVFEGESASVHLYALEDMFVYAERLPIKKQEIEKKKEEPKKPQPTATFTGQIITTDHLVNNIPDESEEDDGLSTPIEDVINLNPDDFADYETDWDFAESVGLQRPKK